MLVTWFERSEWSVERNSLMARHVLIKAKDAGREKLARCTRSRSVMLVPLPCWQWMRVEIWTVFHHLTSQSRASAFRLCLWSAARHKCEREILNFWWCLPCPIHQSSLCLKAGQRRASIPCATGGGGQCRVEIYFKVLAVEMKTYLIQTVRMIVDGYSYNVANIALGRTLMANAQLASLSINTSCLLHG